MEHVYRQLALMAKSGLPLPVMLRELAGTVRSRRFRTALAAMSAQATEGMSMAATMRAHPRWFKPLAIDMVEQGEQHGTLVELLDTAAEISAIETELVTGMRMRMFYPLISIVIAITLFGLLLISVVPSYTRMFDEMLAGEPLPIVTQVVIALSSLLRDHLVLFALVWIVVMVVMVIAMTNCVWGNRFMSGLLWFLPGAMRIRKAADLARLCKLLALHVEHRLPLDPGLQQLAGMMETASVRDSVIRWHEQTRVGVTLPQILADEEHLDPLLVVAFQHLREEELAGALRDLAAVYEARARMTLNLFLDVWMIGSVALMVLVSGLVVIAMFLPLIKLIDVMGGV